MDDAIKKKCPICGKEFFVLACDQWVYKRHKYGGEGYYYYCSWHCMREDERRHAKPKKPLHIVEADKMHGARRQPMYSRDLINGLLEAIEEAGGDPKAGAEYLESMGYEHWKKYFDMKQWAEKYDPELRKRMPEKLTDKRRKEAQA